MKILIVDNNDSFTYNLVQVIKQYGKCELEIIKNEHMNLNGINKYDKILFTPGPGIPSDFPAMFDILKTYEKSKSILGVCLGHQAIAEFFGGKLINNNSVMHGRKTEIKIVEKSGILFKNLPEKFNVGLYHSWSVSKESLPDCLKITSLSKEDVIMSISHKNYKIHGVQFHPESIVTKFGKEIIYNWLSE